MRYRYLTFDCYGTLVDWRSGIEREMVRALGGIRLGGKNLLDAYGAAERREESNFKKYREVLRLSVLSMSNDLGVPVGKEAADGFSASVPWWPLFPDTAAFLREMGSRGYRRYILSNVDNDLLEGTIKNGGLEIDGFVTSEEIGSYKPRTAHWTEFLRRTGASKDEVLHVAQSIFHDIFPAQQLGIDAAWVNRYTEPLPPEIAPSLISDSLANLAILVD